MVRERAPHSLAVLLFFLNLGREAWTLTRPDGSVVDMPAGRTAPILEGNRINFGLRTGEIWG